jgi:hypothetical protein
VGFLGFEWPPLLALVRHPSLELQRQGPEHATVLHGHEDRRPVGAGRDVRDPCEVGLPRVVAGADELPVGRGGDPSGRGVLVRRGFPYLHALRLARGSPR